MGSHSTMLRISFPLSYYRNGPFTGPLLPGRETMSASTTSFCHSTAHKHFSRSVPGSPGHPGFWWASWASWEYMSLFSVATSQIAQGHLSRAAQSAGGGKERIDGGHKEGDEGLIAGTGVLPSIIILRCILLVAFVSSRRHHP